ncbi:hypothetical protein ANN_00757, partial [Periplaneta americana]
LLRINRHNTVRSLIAASIRQNASYEVYEEVGCVSSDGSTRRADIIIIDRQKDKGVILDPTIRFEMPEQQPQEVCREKQVIYEPCCQHLGAQYHITHWTVFGLMFGARGTIPRETLNQLKQYKISDATIDAIGSHVLKSSLAIISDNADEMSPGSSTESYPAFARIGLRKTPEKPQPGNLPRPGFEPGPPGFAARRADRYSTGVDLLFLMDCHIQIKIFSSVYAQYMIKTKSIALKAAYINHMTTKSNEQSTLFTDNLTTVILRPKYRQMHTFSMAVQTHGPLDTTTKKVTFSHIGDLGGHVMKHLSLTPARLSNDQTSPYSGKHELHCGNVAKPHLAVLLVSAKEEWPSQDCLDEVSGVRHASRKLETAVLLSGGQSRRPTHRGVQIQRADRQTERGTDREKKDRRRDKRIGEETDEETNGQYKRQTDSIRDKQTGEDTNGQAKKQTDRRRGKRTGEDTNRRRKKRTDERQTDSRRDKRTGEDTNGQAKKQTRDKRTVEETNGQAKRQTDRRRDKRTVEETNGQSKIQTDS